MRRGARPPAAGAAGVHRGPGHLDRGAALQPAPTAGWGRGAQLVWAGGTAPARRTGPAGGRGRSCGARGLCRGAPPPRRAPSGQKLGSARPAAEPPPRRPATPGRGQCRRPGIDPSRRPGGRTRGRGGRAGWPRGAAAAAGAGRGRRTAAGGGGGSRRRRAARSRSTLLSGPLAEASVRLRGCEARRGSLGQLNAAA